MPEGKVLARLGDLLYWLGCILAAIVIIWGARVGFADDNPNGPYIFSFAAAAGFAFWAIGLACWHIFSGK